MKPIRGLLIDLDGVLYVGSAPVPGAKEALTALREAGIQRRFITNTTTRSADAVVAKLHRLGFEVEPEEVFSAVTATKWFLRGQGDGRPRIHLLVRDSILTEFEEFPHDAIAPDYVIVGDIGAAWSYSLMNQAFNLLQRGARLVTMHKNKFFQSEEGLKLDIGAFVAGLEYVTGHQARIIGKPSPEFFERAVESLGLPRQEVAMIGDDIETDVDGGQRAGLTGILVQTGKYREAFVAESGIVPDVTLATMAELPAWLEI